jgi:hypothetical protein
MPRPTIRYVGFRPPRSLPDVRTHDRELDIAPGSDDIERRFQEHIDPLARLICPR